MLLLLLPSFCMLKPLTKGANASWSLNYWLKCHLPNKPQDANTLNNLKRSTELESLSVSPIWSILTPSDNLNCLLAFKSKFPVAYKKGCVCLESATLMVRTSATFHPLLRSGCNLKLSSVWSTISIWANFLWEFPFSGLDPIPGSDLGIRGRHGFWKPVWMFSKESSDTCCFLPVDAMPISDG